MSANTPRCQQNDQQYPQPNKVIVFDYDQTISVFHVFSCLAGYMKPSENALNPKGPWAQSETGQLRRVIELDAESKGKFIDATFGGQERIVALDNMFHRLRMGGAELHVCSKGLIAPIRYSLERAGLLSHFRSVYGRIDNYYEANRNPFDEESLKTYKLPSQSPAGNIPQKQLVSHLGRTKYSDSWIQKADLCLQLAERRKRENEAADTIPVMLVEDDPREIEKAQKKQVSTCYVEEREGMMDKEMSEILKWVGVEKK